MINMIRNKRCALLFIAVTFICNLVYALTICSKCGHEIEDGAKVCPHCNAAVVQKKEVPTSLPDDVVEDDSVAELADAYIQKQYKLAGKQSRNPGIAFAYYQNAFAVLRLIPVDERSGRIGKAIMRNMNQSRKAMIRGKVPCRLCKGTGKYKVDLGRVDGSKNVKFVDGVKCKRCKGLGYSIEHLSVDRIKMNILKGHQSFEQQRMVAGDQKMGRAYVSLGLAHKLILRQKVLVMTGIPAPCKKCQYTGLQVCRACKGTKWEKCPAENCNNGVIEVSGSSSRNRMKKKRLNGAIREICGRCKGSGEISCQICQGKGCVICEECNGTGEAPRCTRCSGVGLITCSKCNGSGKYNGEVCTKCSGEGVLLCPTCKGEGSVSK